MLLILSHSEDFLTFSCYKPRYNTEIIPDAVAVLASHDVERHAFLIAQTAEMLLYQNSSILMIERNDAAGIDHCMKLSICDFSVGSIRSLIHIGKGSAFC